MQTKQTQSWASRNELSDVVDKHLPNMRQNVLYVCNLIELMVVLLCKCHINKYRWILHLKFYLFSFGCAESSLPCVDFLYLRQVGAILQLQHECFSLRRLLSWSTGSRARRLHQLQLMGFNCSVSYGIFLDQGWNPRPLQ